LRAVTAAERAELERVARMGSERADRVARARALLAVVDGSRFTEAARVAGRRSGDAVGRLVGRFNREGLAAVAPRYGGGPPPRYGTDERERILRELRRAPDRERDGTATWSLTTLRRALRRAPDGLPRVSTATILGTLWEAGYRWQRDRTWCHTGQARRRRRDGTVVAVTDPQATPKKR
jgi:transposase